MPVFTPQPSRKAPQLELGAVRWLRQNLFSSLTSSAFTLLALYIIYLTVPALANWMYFDATFAPVSNEQCGREGACWRYIIEKLDLFIYGFYPTEEVWRPQLVLALALSFVFMAKALKQYAHKVKIIIGLIVIYPIIAFFLLYGGLGLTIVETHQWGGLMLTIVVATVGIVASFPIGVLLALGRQSKMRFIRLLSVVYIEFIRGIPLITILFMASVVLPLFFSEGINMDKLLRALIGITLFQAAYIAEVVRGGLQAVPKGQYEAADAMGLSFIQKTGLIILPQALKISIPNIVGSFIALFKDTTLLLIIGLFDILSMVHLTSSDELWLGRSTEGYVFVMMVLWVILYSMSQYSKKLELKYNTEHKN
ncbi:amino acid ABC transporter permease [Bathymodiolus septemdierum thioautotrophic gill symbiont]|uniref:General L-amino acid transport system permease protein n=1 Tax=endosymbiont of Bathymodiolus septemdierum str. Myojin knoll TaxID=1303921 RepID=A0A0P0US00_9GAMM|nr:amino acid ABC transporter permease [Bathymodiolus septemdierum thioautotrophic gill symbiont]BAS67857.1 general L-amino acid transport system permease protein [endosymbiont of Bathymodiolus septemdierum str. Myojin knoll]